MVAEEDRDYNQLYLKKAQRAARLLKLIPWILLVGISGSLTNKQARQSSDIDFFIVCRSGRIYLSRFWSKLILLALGWARRNHDSNPAGKICLNYFLSEQSLDFKPHADHVVRSYKHSIILFSRGETLASLIQANNWLKPKFQLSHHRKHHFWQLRFNFVDRIENILRRYQIRLIESDPRTALYPKQIIYNDLELRFHPPKEEFLLTD